MKKILKKRKDGIRQTYWTGNLEKLTTQNKYFRKVIYTSKNEQLVAMMIPVNGQIGNEVHKTHDQFFRIEQGTAKIIVKNKKHFILKAGGGLVINKGTYHNVINAGNKPLKLYTIYSPPNHPKGTIDKTRFDAILREKGIKPNEFTNLVRKINLDAPGAETELFSLNTKGKNIHIKYP